MKYLLHNAHLRKTLSEEILLKLTSPVAATFSRTIDKDAAPEKLINVERLGERCLRSSVYLTMKRSDSDADIRLNDKESIHINWRGPWSGPRGARADGTARTRDTNFRFN